jgi:hypothetical protein
LLLKLAWHIKCRWDENIDPQIVALLKRGGRHQTPFQRSLFWLKTCVTVCGSSKSSLSIMNPPEDLESPRKKVKFSAETEQPAQQEPAVSSAEASAKMLLQDLTSSTSKEAEVGITDYVSAESPGFRGLLKKRYTDFLVNEILPNGQVVHLQRLGSTPVSQIDGDFPPAVSSERNGTRVQSSATAASGSTIEPPTAKLEAPSNLGASSEQLKHQQLEGDAMPVSSLGFERLLG